jgi:hypothetical protein
VASHPDAGPPFVQPVITADGLQKWAKKNSELTVQEEAFMGLVDGPIRRAWVCIFLFPSISLFSSLCNIEINY